MTDKKIDDGGPAFPGEMTTNWTQGMSLRDWIAGQALAGIFATNPQSSDDILAGVAYAVADVMIEARKVK
jgi:hypothetical protein